jgi:hypothetical protein
MICIGMVICVGALQAWCVMHDESRESMRSKHAMWHGIPGEQRRKEKISFGSGLHVLAVARKQTASREILLWMTPSEAPKALQASECSELLDPMRAICWISAQH